MHRSRALLLMLLLALALTVVACGSDDGDDGSGDAGASSGGRQAAVGTIEIYDVAESLFEGSAYRDAEHAIDAIGKNLPDDAQLVTIPDAEKASSLTALQEGGTFDEQAGLWAIFRGEPLAFAAPDVKRTRIVPEARAVEITLEPAAAKRFQAFTKKIVDRPGSDGPKAYAVVAEGSVYAFAMLIPQEYPQGVTDGTILVTIPQQAGEPEAFEALLAD